MRNALLVFLSIVFLVFSSQVFAQDFNATKNTLVQSKISDQEARQTMDKLADESKGKLAEFLKKEDKQYSSISFVDPNQALALVDKYGRNKVLVDKSYIRVSGTVTSTYVLFIPE